MDNGYVLWTFQGKQLAQASFEAFCQFAWRPRELLHRRKKLRKLQRISKSMRSSAMHLTRLRNVSSDCKRRKASAKVGLSSEMSWLDLPSGEHGRRWNGWSYWGDMTVTMRRTIQPRRLLLRRSLTQRRTLFTRLIKCYINFFQHESFNLRLFAAVRTTLPYTNALPHKIENNCFSYTVDSAKSNKIERK